MVEFSTASSNDVKNSPSDDNKCNELQLSSVHVHRGLLSSVDLLTNHDKNNDCMEDNSKCDIVKQSNALPSIDDIDKSGRVTEEKDLEMHTSQEISALDTIQDKSRGIRKRKRTSWRSNHIRRQRNVKGKLSRAEMPYDELLKLREKERIAQQQRRERIRKCRAKKSRAHKEAIAASSVAKFESQDEAATNISAPGSNTANLLLRYDSEDIDVQPVAELHDKEKTDALILESTESDNANDGQKFSIPSETDQKIQFMKALGLKCKVSKPMLFHNANKTHDRSEHVENAEDTMDSNSLSKGRVICEKCDETIIDDQHTSICGNCWSNFDETSQSSLGEEENQFNSLSECSSETGDSNSAIDSSSLNQLKRVRRNNLPKDELERLREKEKMAKRRQRAKSKTEQKTTSTALYNSEASNYLENAFAKVNEDTRTNQLVVDQDTQRETAKQDDLSDKNENETPAEKALKINDDTIANDKALVKSAHALGVLSKSEETRRKLINRFCDRSMLSPAELESLRKREREYQRKRRARLRQMKYNCTGQDQKDDSSTLETAQKSSNNHLMQNENAFKKYETRRSNGISRPSQKYLENSSMMLHEYVDDAKKNENSYDRKNGVEKFIPETLQARSSISNNQALKIDNKDESQYNFNSSLKKTEDSNFDSGILLQTGRDNASNFIRALYASDYKNTESSYKFSELEASLEPHPRERSRLERLVKSEWRNTYSRSLPEDANDGYFSGKFYYGRSCSNKSSPDIKDDSKDDDDRRLIDKRARECNSQKWRHWKSGLSEDQLQRRRQSNREAQRRRRMRLKMIQMKTSQDLNIRNGDPCYKKQELHDVTDDREVSLSICKSRLEDMLAKRQRVFLDAQMEKAKSQIPKHVEFPCQNAVKSRGCRIKVTPQRQVIVPSMSYVHDLENNVSQNYCEDNSIESSTSEPSPEGYFEDLTMIRNQENQNDTEEDGTLIYSTSSRKRKQFCPRRLLTDAERINNKSMQRIAIAQS